MHAGAALGKSMLALGHAMAQALGGRYGLPHGAAERDLPAAGAALQRRGRRRTRSRGSARRSAATRSSASRSSRALGGYERLRDLGVPEEDLAELAEAVVAAARREGEPAAGDPAEIEELLRSVY